MKSICLLIFLLPIIAFTQSDKQEFVNYSKYASDNKKLINTKKEINTVFMGNSITEGWYKHNPDFFDSNNFVNRGIGGEVSSQMLLRFREDVIKLKPNRVVILAGTNDIAENQGPISLDKVLGNIISMTELAQSNNIEVVLASVLPADRFEWRKELEPADKITTLNNRIQKYAEEKDILFINYHPKMANGKNGMKTEYSGDGVHPNKKGYNVMEKETLNTLQ